MALSEKKLEEVRKCLKRAENGEIVKAITKKGTKFHIEVKIDKDTYGPDPMFTINKQTSSGEIGYITFGYDNCINTLRALASRKDA